MKMRNKQKPELIELLINGEIVSQLKTDSYVVVPDRSKPKGFTEHFALLLSEVPNIHSPNKPEFFSHVFLGSVLTLPSTGLMEKLHIQDIFFRVTGESCKLVFKIDSQDGYKLKFFIVSAGKSRIEFTKEELSQLKSQISDTQTFSGSASAVEGYILRISQDDGFKLQVSSDNTCQGFTELDKSVDSTIKMEKNKFVKVEKSADQKDVFSSLVDKLSSSVAENVHKSFEDILTKLKFLYIAQQKDLKPFKSEAAYHGFIYGFFRLNYKYANALDCYVEKIAGVGYADLVLLSRKGNTNPFLIVLEIKDGTGRDASAEDAISQIKDRGYIYHLPSVRTEASKAIIVGTNWGIPAPKRDGDTQDLKVEIVDVHNVRKSIVERLINDIKSNQRTEVVRDNIEKQVEHLYYSLSIKHKDPQYFSRVLVGQSISLQNQETNSFLFEYPGTITGGTVTTLFYKNGVQGIVLNVLEVQKTSQQLQLHIDEGSSTRSTAKVNVHDWHMIPVQSLGISDCMAVQIVINTKASSFDQKTGKEKGYIESINIEKLKIEPLTKVHTSSFLPLDKFIVGDVIYSMFDHHVPAADVNSPPAFKKMKLGIVEAHKKIDVNDLFKQCFIKLGTLISHESDVQAILHGCFIGQQYEEKDLRVFSEVSYGSGRADLVIFIKDEQNPRQEKIALFEVKKPDLGTVATYENAFLDSKLQLTEYIKYLKSSTDSKKVSAISVIYNSADKQVHFKQFNSKIEHTSQSSSDERMQLVENRIYKQEKLSSVVDYELLSAISKTNILDFSSYHFSTIDYITLKNFFIYRYANLAKPIQLNLSNKQDIENNIDLVAEILKYDVWINNLKLSNCNLKYPGLVTLTDALISKENLKVLEEGSASQKKFISQNKKYIKGFYLKSLDLSDNPFSDNDAALLHKALSAMYGLERLALSQMDGAGVKHITNGLINSNALVSLKLSNLKGGLNAEGAKELVQLFAQHPMLEELDLSHNQMGQENMDLILRDAKLVRIKELDLSNNKGNIELNIDVQSLKSFISANKALKTWKFADNAIGDIGLKDLLSVLSKSHIKVLDISGNDITDIDGNLLPKTLTCLILSNNKITHLHTESFAHLNSLNMLYIANNVNLQNVPDILDFANDNEFMHLSVSDIDFNVDNNMLKLKNLINYNEYLTSLSLSGCGIDDKIAKRIFDMLELSESKLNVLDLSNNKIMIADESVISGKRTALDERTGFIVFNDNLEELNLANNKIGDKGGEALVKALQARSQHAIARKQMNAAVHFSIDLSKNKFTNVFAAYVADKLHSLSCLESLSLKDNNFDLRYTNQLVNAVYNNHNIKHFDIGANNVHLDDMVRLSSYLIHNSYKLNIAQEMNSAISASACLAGSSRSKRFINGCKISWDDVDVISRTKTRNKKKIIIDMAKFLKYSKQHVGDIEKKHQLISLVNEIKSEDPGRVVGKYQNILDKVMEEGGYKQYIEHDRLNYFGHQTLIDNNITPKWKAALVTNIGRIQIGYGTYSTFVTCQQTEYADCTLGITEIGYSFLSQPIAKKISKKLSDSVLVKKMVRVHFTKNAADMAAHGMTEAVSVVFDIIDITRASIQLIQCSKRTDGEEACSDKEIRDAIASIALSGISSISGITLLALSASTIVTVAVGAVIFVVQVIYSGVSNIIEYSKKYNTTNAENWSIFWKTALFQKMSEDVEHLAARHETVNMLVRNAWEILKNYPDEVVAISLGLGKEYIEYTKQCIMETRYGSETGLYFGQTEECYQVPLTNVKPSYSRIDMSHKHYNNTMKLSRVLPTPIENTTMICLPKITRAEYEKELYQSHTKAMFKCENAAVILHKPRAAMQSTDAGKTIVHYLKYITSGSVIGSLEWNNYFAIFGGNASIFGTSVSFNTFELLGNDYSGNIHLSANSSNTLKLGNFKQFKNVTVEYSYTIPLGMHMLITIDGTTSQLDALQEGVKIQYVGSDKTLDKIVCTVQQFPLLQAPKIDSDDGVIIDSGGVKENRGGLFDSIINCHTVLMSPNTVIAGIGKGYTVYVKQPNYTTGKFYSSVYIPGGANIMFQMSLFKECEKIEYSALFNNLNIYISLSGEGVYTLSLLRYMNGNHTTDYVLIDKHNARIYPLIDFTESGVSHTTVKNFLVRKDIQENFSIESAILYYHNTTYTGKNYHISTEIRYRKDIVCMFGSIGDDLIVENNNTILMSGGEGRDVYIIADKKKDELYIYNNANDLKLDFLVIPSIKDSMVKRHVADVELHFASKKIILSNYLLDSKYQHIVITDQAQNTVVPFLYDVDKISLQPFYYPISPTKNVYILTPNIIPRVISIHPKDIEFHKQGSNLLMTDKREPFGILNIILQDYYAKKDQWKLVKLYSYDNGAVGDVIDLKNIVLQESNAGIVSHIHDSIIQKYDVDLSKRGKEISHNNKLGVGIILFHNTSLDNLSVERHQSNLVLRSSVSNNKLVLNKWYIPDHDRVLAFEFDDGLEAKRIWLSDGFENRINFNYKLSNEIKNMDTKLLIVVLDYLITMQDNHYQTHTNASYTYSFLENEDRNIVDSSRTMPIEKKIQLLKSTNYNAGKVLMLLLAKHYNKLLLEHVHTEKESLDIIHNSCFGTIVNFKYIKSITECLNSSIENEQLVLDFIDSKKTEIQEIMTTLASTTHHQHRHHHGENILNHQRTRRNTNEYEKQEDEDIKQYYTDDITSDQIAESIFGIESSNLTWDIYV